MYHCADIFNLQINIIVIRLLHYIGTLRTIHIHAQVSKTLNADYTNVVRRFNKVNILKFQIHKIGGNKLVLHYAIMIHVWCIHLGRSLYLYSN